MNLASIESAAHFVRTYHMHTCVQTNRARISATLRLSLAKLVKVGKQTQQPSIARKQILDLFRKLIRNRRQIRDKAVPIALAVDGVTPPQRRLFEKLINILQ